MACSTCHSNAFRSITHAMAKAAGAKWRAMGAGATATDWNVRAEVCERCPMRIVHRNTSYCGRPFLNQIDRDPGVDGCGCPTIAKAKTPGEHCPLDVRHLPVLDSVPCSCKWCAAVRADAHRLHATT